ncbi:MAG: hypothetical protein J7K04_13020 [Spirochaetales bacterium]|nr:hypothetical protein [Spirochaetales bacterium]
MLESEKIITGDWIDTREASKDFYSLISYFKPSAEEIKRQIEAIRGSVEAGLTEYKRAGLIPVFIALENMKYQSLNAWEMYKQELNSKYLLYVIMLQKMLTQKTIPLSTEKVKESDESIDVDINTIIQDIRERINKDPASKNNPSVKKILMQVSLYTKERSKLKELFYQIKSDKIAAYLSNFVNVYDTIFLSIRKNYSELLREEKLKEKKQQEVRVLSLIPMKELTEIYSRQAKAVSRISSTLRYARAEKYKTREILVKLFNDRESILKTIKDEEEASGKICARTAAVLKGLSLNECSKKLKQEFKREILILLEKTLKEIT